MGGGESFVPARAGAGGAAGARSLGVEADRARMRGRAALLEELLGGYNDGRRKTRFSTAAYLLPPEDLRAVLERLRAQAEGLELKERAALAAQLLTEAAQALGLSLKLVKKP